MKSYLNRYQRECIYFKTTLGAVLELNITLKKLFREIEREIIKTFLM